MTQSPAARSARGSDEGGTSLVELALIVTFLTTLLMGVIVFGILLGKRQVLTQAAAEGARAAVPYQYSSADTSAVTNAAQAQVNKSLEGVDRVCGDGSTTCSFVVYSCGGVASPPTAPTGTGDCLKVSVVLEVAGASPLVPTISLISPFLPSTMTSEFTVTLANPT